MNKRFKKRSKPNDPGVDTVPGERDSGLGNPPRNLLAELDERIADLERLSRGRKKRKNPGNQNTCSSQRPNSVPSKTVSFSPYTRHGGGEEAPPEKQASNFKSKCGYCNSRRRRATRTTSPCRQRFAVNRTNSSDKEERFVSPNSVSDSSEFFTDVSSSPGPAKYYRDYPGSAGDQKHSWHSDTARSNHSEDRDLSSASAYYNKRFAWAQPHSRNSWVSYGSSEIARSTSDELLRFRTNRLSHCLTSEDVLGHDSKIDRLLAKYSDYSYPRQQSPPLNYFPYKSSFLDFLVTGTSNNNRSVLSKFELLNTSLSARRQRAAKNAFLSVSLPTSYMTFFSKYKGLVEPSEYAYNRSMNCVNDPGRYTSLSSRACSSDPLLENKRFKIYRSDYPITATLASATSDSDVKKKFDRWIKPWFEKQTTTFQSKYSTLLLGRPIAVSSILSKKPKSFLDDIKVRDKFYSIFCKASMPSRTSEQSSKGSLGFQIDSQEYKQSNFTGKSSNQGTSNRRYNNSNRKYNLHSASDADSVFNYNLNSSRSIVSDLQPHQSANDIVQRPPSAVNASRTSHASSLQSQDSIFTTSIKNCATNSGYMSLLKFEKSYLDKLDLPNISQDKSDNRLQLDKLETLTPSARWNSDDKEIVKGNFGSNSRNNLSCSL